MDKKRYLKQKYIDLIQNKSEFEGNNTYNFD